MLYIIEEISNLEPLQIITIPQNCYSKYGKGVVVGQINQLGQPHGIARIAINVEVRLEGQFENGLLHGWGREILNYRSYNGWFQNGKKHGFNVESDQSGRIY